MHTQVVVLGAGPGGYAAAFLAADEGQQVTIVETEPRLGGTCLLRGCIPSKALLHVARVFGEVDQLRTDWGVSFGQPEIQVETLRKRKEKVITTLSSGLQHLAKRRNVTVIQARGVFENSTTLRLEGDHQSIPEGGRLSFDHAILATGSMPTIPPSFDIGSDRVLDSTSALELREIPKALLVIGGGYIGLEMGTVFAHLGSQVSVVELTDSLLPGVDNDLVKPLQKRLTTLFDQRIYLETNVVSLAKHDDHIQVVLDGPGKSGVEQKFDQVLVAVGRRPMSQGMGLENTAVQVDSRGFVQCDAQQRTHQPQIFAIGDVAGEPMLAHKASHQGKVAIESLLGRPTQFEPRAIPAVVFTDPEIAWAGLTSQQAEQDQREVSMAVYPWAASGRAHALGRIEGLTKWIVDPQSDQVLGCGMVGPGAGELIAEAVLAIEMGCEMRDVADSIHPHPTFSETMMNAAEVHFGTATEIYKPKSGTRR